MNEVKDMNVQNALAKLKANTAALSTGTASTEEVEDSVEKVLTIQAEDAAAEPAPEEPAPTEGPNAEFQQYTSAVVATCLFTKLGKRINFANYEYYTKDPECIEYMNKAIAEGLRGFKKGLVVRAEDINPMASLKRKHIEEFLASQEGRDYTSKTADPAALAKKAGILSSTGVTAHT